MGKSNKPFNYIGAIALIFKQGLKEKYFNEHNYKKDMDSYLFRVDRLHACYVTRQLLDEIEVNYEKYLPKQYQQL